MDRNISIQDYQKNSVLSNNDNFEYSNKSS